MELKIDSALAPQKITFNYEELKEELIAKVNEYKTLIYSEDQIAFAKKDRANLNALKKALNDERIKREKEFMKPFEEFKAQIKELCNIIDSGASVIDAQVKEFEDQQKQEKAEAIKALWEKHGADEWMIKNDPKWLNASTSLKSIETTIADHLLKIQQDLDTLDGLNIGFDGMAKYQETLDLNQAIAAEAMAKSKAEAKAKWEAEQQMKIEMYQAEKDLQNEGIEETAPTMASNIEETVRKWIGFQAYLSVDEAKMLGCFLKENNIKYKAI